MEAGTVEHRSLALALSQAGEWLQALQKRQQEGLSTARRSLGDALAAVLREEERLWAQARAERLRLQQELAAIQEGNVQAGQAGAARIEALLHQLHRLHTRLLEAPEAVPPAETAQEATDLLAHSTGLVLTLTWAHFVPQPVAASLGQLHLEEQVTGLSLSHDPARMEDGQTDSAMVPVDSRGEEAQGAQPPGGRTACASGLGGEEPSLGSGLPSSGGEEAAAALSAAETGREAEEGTGRALPARELPGVPTVAAGEMPGGCPPVAQTEAGLAPAEGTTPATTPLDPGTLFHARAVLVQEDTSGSSRESAPGAAGHLRDAALLGSRVPSARAPLPRWASAESLGRPQEGGGSHLGGTQSREAQPQRGGWLPAQPSAVLPRSPKAAAPPCNQLVGQWGSRGRGQEQLCLPHGLHAAAVALYVVDFGNRRLQEVGAAGRRVLPLRGKAHFDVALGTGGHLALSNAALRRVELYSAGGLLLHVLRQGFGNPRGVAAGGSQFLVADPALGALHVLAAAGGRLVRREVVPGFQKPYLVATNSRGEVAVSERGLDGGCCVKVLGPAWRVLRVLGGRAAPPLLTNPWGVSLDEAGRVLVADWGRLSHALLCYPACGQGWPVATEGLSSPRGVALLGERHVVVADSMHHCLKAFRYR